MTSEKSHAEQIAETQAEIDKLAAKKADLEQKAAYQEYPKHVTVKGEVFQVENAEHEKAVLAGTQPAPKVESPAKDQTPPPEVPSKEKDEPEPAKAKPEHPAKPDHSETKTVSRRGHR